ncbi:MAG: hypothetical protein ACR2H1_15445 [Limisphaerales bacterium]
MNAQTWKTLKRLIIQNSMTFSNGKSLAYIQTRESFQFSNAIGCGEFAERFEIHTKKYSAIHQAMISHKPPHLSVYEYSSELCREFGGKKKTNPRIKARRTTREAATWKNTGTQTRRGAATYIATQNHNILQEALKNKLITKYGEENVFMEQNFVDIKVVQPDRIYFYEVKSSSYASGCIIEALGQILSYAHIDDDIRPK